ncbi:MAG: AgmX/PglI C-terminal domain-containing protein [Enhygromyxa sp.]
MPGSKPSKVLRVAVIVDGESCEELHQTEPGDISIERASGSSLSLGPSLDIETGIAAEGGPGEQVLPRILMVLGILMVLIGGGLFTREVNQHVSDNAVLESRAADPAEAKDDRTSTIALAVAMLGVVPLVTGATMLRGRRRRRRQSVTVYDGWAQPKDHRKHAPIWLGVGAILVLGGGGLFAYEVDRHSTDVEITNTTRGDMSAFRRGDDEGTGGLGLLLLLVGIAPLVVGLMGLNEEPVAVRKRRPKGGRAPGQHKLFEWVPSEGVYYIDIPPETRGKIALGSNKATVEQLRKRFARGDTLRLKLGAKAKGKLLIGQTRILFQTARPAAEAPKPAFPTEYVDPLALLRPTSLDVATFGAAAGVAVLLGVWFVHFADRTPAPPSERFVREMGIPASFYEDKQEEEPEEAEEEVLKVEDKQKEETKKDEVDEDKIKRPDNVSEKAFREARGVGVARVLGTYGGPGEGTVLDIIESTENNLGDLFAQGMSTTAHYEGGEIGDFVAGGGGINATGTVASNEGLVTGEGPAEVGATRHSERKVKGVAKGSTDNVFGDVDKKAVSATIRQRMPGLQACYEKALRSNPNLKGKMSYTITINPQGRVTAVDVEVDTVNDAGVKSCTVAKIKGWRFFSEGAEESSEVSFSVSFTGS